MLNFIWLGMMFLSVITAFLQGRLDQVVKAVTDSATLGFELALGLAAIMSLWLGIMAIASESGLINIIARALQPLMRRLFPEVPVDHPAMGAMVLNIAANMLGLSNAATPFGLEAMKELELLNKHAEVATDSMCTFLAINTSSVQLIPITGIAYLAANGSLHPSNIILTSAIATTVSTVVALFSVKKLAKLSFFRIKKSESV